MREVVPSSRIPCFVCDCDIYNKEQENQNKGDYSCCAWYINHHVINDEMTNQCPTYKKYMEARRRKNA